MLATVGVDDEAIALDYARTAAAIDVIRRRLASRPTSREVPEQFLAVEAATMRELLRGLTDEYGSVPGYLQARGLEPEAADALPRRTGHADRIGNDPAEPQRSAVQVAVLTRGVRGTARRRRCRP